MVKMKKMTHRTQPEPNPFLQCTPSVMSEAETCVITTSTPASPDEPQPSLSQEESQQQPKSRGPENVPETAPPVLVIQPQASSQGEEDVETAQQEDMPPSTESVDVPLLEK